jgi:hypothetical protein
MVGRRNAGRAGLAILIFFLHIYFYTSQKTPTFVGVFCCVLIHIVCMISIKILHGIFTFAILYVIIYKIYLSRLTAG